MYYLKNYRIQFKTVASYPSGLQSTVIIDISDTQSGESIEWGYEELRGAVDAFTLDYVNNDEDKFSPIRAKKATIQFNSTNRHDLNTFTGDDDRYLVHIHIQETSETILKGFLVLDDMREPYMPKPNVVTLTATDNLGLLKDVALTDTDGKNPRGKYNLIQYVAWCLQKTGLNLDIYVGNNIQEQHNPTEVIFQSMYQDAKTYEAEVGTSIDCYSVLERILGEGNRLTQQRGAWYIMRLDEYEWADQNFRLHLFDYEGNYVEEQPNQNLDIEIGAGLDMKFSQEATEVLYHRPMKSIKETFNYVYPQEIIDNIDFDRGDEFSVTGNDHKYNIDEWTWGRWKDDNSSTPASGKPHIYRQIVDDYEKERYIVLPDAESLPDAMLRSNAVPLGFKDKGTISVDFRQVNAPGNLNVSVLGLLLVSESGKYYVWSSSGIWVKTVGANSMSASQYRYPDASQIQEWQTISIDFGPVPEDGDLYVYLQCAAGDGTDPGRVIHYQNLTFDYKPFINGSYQKYKGQYTKIEQPAGLRSTRDNPVYLSDSPRKLFKGALMYKWVRVVLGITFSGYRLANGFWNGGVPSLYNNKPDDILHPFGHLQAYEVWNQYNRVMRVFEATIQGLQLNVGCPGLINRYKFTDSSVHNTGKFFILLHCSQDFYTGEWKGTFAEVFDTAIGKEYESAKEFKYLSDRA